MLRPLLHLAEDDMIYNNVIGDYNSGDTFFCFLSLPDYDEVVDNNMLELLRWQMPLWLRRRSFLLHVFNVFLPPFLQSIYNRVKLFADFCQ